MVDFYYLPGSSPCRSVIMAAKAVGVELNKKLLNLQAGEHLKPEFLKINPQHTIPTLVDNGFALWESRAILVYLVEKYGRFPVPQVPQEARRHQPAPVLRSGHPVPELRQLLLPTGVRQGSR